MSRTFIFRPTRVMLLVMAAFVFGASSVAAAQDQQPNCTEQCVEGLSIIVPSDASTPGAPEIATWSETYVTPDLAEYYGADVVGGLLENGALIAGPNEADEVPYTNYAYGGWELPVRVGDTYKLESDHYVVAYFYGYDAYGDPLYYNPGGPLVCG